MNKKILAGKKILLTRTLEQASEIKEKLEKYGAEVFSLPTIRIVPPKSYSELDKAINEVETYQWIIFTSQNAADYFFQRYFRKNKTLVNLKKIKIGAIGPATRKNLEEYNLKIVFQPKKYTSEGIVKEFKTKKFGIGGGHLKGDYLKGDYLKGERILLPRADIAPQWLPEQLSKLGFQVTQVVAYRTEREKKIQPGIKKMLKNGKIDFVVFTSSSTVKNFLALIPKKKLHPKIKFVSIGPVTTKTARELGLKIFIQAEKYTTAGLVKAILSYADYRR